MVVMIGALMTAGSEARAETMCLDFGIGEDLWDASPQPRDGDPPEDFLEERGRDEGPGSYPAQRWLARIEDDDTGDLLWGWQPLDGDGCATYPLPSGTSTLRVSFVRWAVWDAAADPNAPDTGNQIVGYDCDPTAGACQFDLETLTATAVVDGTTRITTAGVGSGPLVASDLGLWSATFAEELFADQGQNPTSDSRIYLAADTSMSGDFLPDATQTDYTFGNQPSVLLEGPDINSKFIAAHEYGHTQTIMVGAPRVGLDDLPDDYDGQDSHDWGSLEWQSVASTEGMASYYAVCVWHDVDAANPNNATSIPAAIAFITPGSADDETQNPISPVPGTDIIDMIPTVQCDVQSCPAGVANEWDWAVALSEFRRNAGSTPSFFVIFRMLREYYETGGWEPDGDTDPGLFWDEFDDEMTSHLGSGYSDWASEAASWEIDQ
jgi:hypothetical protein